MYDGVGHNMPDVDCGTKMRENVQLKALNKGSAKGNNMTSMRPVKTRIKQHNTQGLQAHSQARPAKKTHPVRDKYYRTHYFSLEAAEPRGWTISKKLRSLIPKATEQMQKRYQNKNTTEN